MWEGVVAEAASPAGASSAGAVLGEVAELKQQGNGFFKQAEYAAAADAYGAALGCSLVAVDPELSTGTVRAGAAAKGEDGVGAPASSSWSARSAAAWKRTATFDAELAVLVEACALNLAACCLKLERPADAQAHCDVALELQRNPKALYRRALARRDLTAAAGVPFAEKAAALKLALADITEARALAPAASCSAGMVRQIGTLLVELRRACGDASDGRKTEGIQSFFEGEEVLAGLECLEGGGEAASQWPLTPFARSAWWQ